MLEGCGEKPLQGEGHGRWGNIWWNEFLLVNHRERNRIPYLRKLVPGWMAGGNGQWGGLGLSVLLLNIYDFTEHHPTGHPASMLDQDKNRGTPRSSLLRQKQEHCENHKGGPTPCILASMIDGCFFPNYGFSLLTFRIRISRISKHRLIPVSWQHPIQGKALLPWTPTRPPTPCHPTQILKALSNLLWFSWCRVLWNESKNATFSDCRCILGGC